MLYNIMLFPLDWYSIAFFVFCEKNEGYYVLQYANCYVLT